MFVVGRFHLGRWPLRAALCVAVLTLLLAAAEALVRVVRPPPKINDYQLADDVLGFRNPHVDVRCYDERGSFPFRSSSRGCRGLELPPPGPRDPSKRRVLLIGDSFLQGWRVREEEWVGNALGDALAAAGEPAEVYTLSANDFGTGQELLDLRTNGPRVQPDEVALLLFPMNDWINNTLELAGSSPISANDYFRPYFVPTADGGLELTHAQPGRAFLRHSVLYRLLEQRWLAGRSFDSLCEELSGEPVQSMEERVLHGRLPEEFYELFRPQSPGSRWEIAWERTQALILATRAEAERQGAGFTVVVIPDLRQVERRVSWIWQMNLMREGGWVEPEEALDLDLPERRLEEWFERTGLRHVVLLGPLRRRVQTLHALMYLNDGHLNGKGHELMGERLAQRLVTGGHDTCFEPVDGQVDVPAFLGDEPTRLDLMHEAHGELFGWGWTGWRPPHLIAPGWGLATSGLLLAHTGFVTIEGGFVSSMSPKKGAESVPLAVRRLDEPDRWLVRRSFDATQPFRISFVLEPRPGEAKWVPMCFTIEDVPWSVSATTGPLLAVQSLRFDSEPPPGWTPEELEAPPHPANWVILYSARLLVRLPPQLLGFLTGRFVPRHRRRARRNPFSRSLPRAMSARRRTGLRVQRMPIFTA
jgi:lysophospholipase L1-like esterase